MAVPRHHVTQDLPCLAVNLHVPTIRAGRLVAKLSPDPQRPVAKRDGGHHAEIVPLAEILPAEIEALQSSVLAVRHIKDALIVHRDPVGLPELSRAVPGAAPLPDALALGRVFENPRVTVAVGYE